MRQGALYSITCMDCKIQGRESIYFGETGRTIFDRGAEHLDLHRKRNQESVLVEHEVKEHNGEVVEWNMDAVEYPRGNLQRQAKEAHMIQKNSHMNLLNRKGD